MPNMMSIAKTVYVDSSNWEFLLYEGQTTNLNLDGRTCSLGFMCFPPLLNRDTPLSSHPSLLCNLCHFLHLLLMTLLHSCWLPRVHEFDLRTIPATFTSATSTSHKQQWAWLPLKIPLLHLFVFLGVFKSLRLFCLISLRVYYYAKVLPVWSVIVSELYAVYHVVTRLCSPNPWPGGFRTVAFIV